MDTRTYIDRIPPPGYTLVQDGNGSIFAVPHFLVQATHTAFDGFKGIRELEKGDIPEVRVLLSLIILFN